MKKLYPYSFLVLVASVLLSVTLSAQETKVTIKVEKDGKMVKDTTYTFDDADQADHAMKIMEVMSGDSLVWISEGEHDGEHTKVMKYKVESGDHPHGEHVMVVKSGDGETFDILMDEEGDCVKTKKITVMVSDGEEGEVEVIVVKKKKSKKQ